MLLDTGENDALRFDQERRCGSDRARRLRAFRSSKP
jgi:hypothetical protein